MNAVILPLCLILVLGFFRVNVIFSLIISSILSGLLGGMELSTIIELFNTGLGKKAYIALSYAMLGAFAVSLSHSGITNFASKKVHGLCAIETDNKDNILFKLKVIILGSLLVMAVLSQNLIPIHIAFIPIVVPPLLSSMNLIKLDRRTVVCVLIFGLVCTYTVIPVGFGKVFLNDILLGNLKKYGLQADLSDVINAMLFPAAGMFIGLLVAVFLSYAKPRHYVSNLDSEKSIASIAQPRKKYIIFACFAIVFSSLIQIIYDHSMVFGALAGYVIISFSGALKKEKHNNLVSQGFNMMSLLAFTMLASSGFAEVLQATGEIGNLSTFLVDSFGQNNKLLISFFMLLFGLLLTTGIGSSFSTIPIIAAIYIPICIDFNFSLFSTIVLIGTATVLGDAGSPVSEVTLGTTFSLNTDDQHEHFYETVLPAFIHFTVPLFICGWIAANYF